MPDVIARLQQLQAHYLQEKTRSYEWRVQQLHNLKKGFLVGILVPLSILCGYLFSKASLIGKAGMTFVYKEYAFLKTWWQGASFVFVVWMALLLLQGWAQQKRKGNWVYIGFIIAAIFGIYFTYQDFRPTIRQRVEVIRQHLHASVAWKGPKPGINEMRRHYTNYLRGLPNIREYRTKLVTLPEVEAIDEVLNEIILQYDGFEFAPRQLNMDAMAYSCDS